ncbi:reverse transcriptase domain-containing protein [Tanacetum coccineum]
MVGACPSGSTVVDSINNLDVGNPLHVQNSDNRNSVIIPFKLLGTENYRIWSGAVKLALQDRNKDQVSILAKDKGFGHEMHKSEESEAIFQQRNESSHPLRQGGLDLVNPDIRLTMLNLGLGNVGSQRNCNCSTSNEMVSILTFIMAEGEIDNVTMEQYLALTRGNQASGMVKLEIGGNVNFEIKSQFMQELREDTFSENKNDDAHEHVERPLREGWTDFHQEPSILDISLRKPLSKESSSSSEGIAAIVNKLENLGRDMKKLKENVHAIQVGCQICEGAHLDKDCPFYEEIKSMEEVKYGEFGRPFPINNRNDGRFNKGGYDHPSSGERRPNLTEIINKYIEEASKRHTEQDEWLKKFYQSTEASREAHDKIIQGLETKVKTLANEVEGRTNNGKFEECKAICTEDGLPLYTPFYYSPEEIEYFSANSGFLDNEKQETDDSGMAEALAALEATLKKKKEEPKKEKQNINYYVDPYEPPIPFPRRLEQHAEESLVHQTMESLNKIKINRPLLKEIRQTDNYAKQMKDLVENKPRTDEEKEIKMNPRCSALLQNHLPPKEQDPGSFILPCSIGKLDFKNALADLGASISIMPFSMYKRLGIGKLEPINMIIEMADNTKCTPKGIVENLLIKIDKFIFPVDFVILDMVEDIRMPIILERPLLATTHAKVDIFRKSISLEVGSEKVIFKMRSSFTTTNFESVRSIKSKTFLEEDDFKKIDYELFLYDSKSCEFNRLLRIDPDIFSYEVDIQESYEEIVYKLTKVEKEKYSAPNICDGGDLPINIEKHYWKSNNDGEREKLEWENLSLNDWMRIRYGKVCKMTEERILKDYWRERFGNEEDDLEENLEDSEKCGKDKANTILGVIHEKLNNDWFNNTSEDEDNLEGILDYLKPRSYDGFIDLDEAYNKRRCRLLGMTYEEPTLIIIEKAKVTRYTLVQARPTQRFSLRRNGIRGLLDAFSYGRKVLYRCDQKGYAVTDIITA